MTVKDILFSFETDVTTDVVSPYALSFASIFGAHLTAVAVLLDMSSTGFVVPDLPYDVLTSARDEAKTQVNEAFGRLSDAAARTGVSAEMKTIEVGLGGREGSFGRFARYFDITLFQQASSDEPSNTLIEAALFGSGRPILVVPYIHHEPAKFEKILLAWDGSSAAARTLGDATPLLKLASRVQAVHVIDVRSDDVRAPDIDIKRHLARHGIDVDLLTLKKAGDVTDTLLSHAADSDADLMVMGGYGHSRFREFVLGGTTRGVLSSMTLPVIMSH
jgi:nucleotide-binding universal stress UspA family protein